MTWRESTLNAVFRQCRINNSDILTLQQLKRKQLPQVIKETGTRSRNPHITLEEHLRQLRDEGKIEFVDYKGTYRLLEHQNIVNQVKRLFEGFYQKVNAVAGVYFDATAGIDLFMKRMIQIQNEQFRSDLKTKELDSAWFIHGEGDPNQPTSGTLHQSTIKEFKERNKRNGSNFEFLGNMCIVAIYQFWEDYYRKKIAELYNIEPSRVESDVLGDISKIRNSIIHNNSVASSKIKHCKLLKWFRPNDKIVIDSEKFKEVLSHLSKLKVVIKTTENHS